MHAPIILLGTGLQPTGGQGALGDTVISRSQPVDGDDPDDILPVSAKMAAARSRENKARRTVVLDSGDEEDDRMERAGCRYHTVGQKQVGTSRIVKSCALDLNWRNICVGLAQWL